MKMRTSPEFSQRTSITSPNQKSNETYQFFGLPSEASKQLQTFRNHVELAPVREAVLPLKVTVASSLLQQAEQARLEARRYLDRRAEIPQINVKQVLIPASDPRCSIRFKTSLIENLQNSERIDRTDRHEK